MPVLANVLLAVAGTDQLRFAATDLYLAVSGKIPAEVESGGAIAVGARDLFERVKMMPDGPIVDRHVGQRDDHAQGRRHRAPLHAARHARRRLPAAPAAGEESATLALEVDVLAELIASTHFSISTDETRAHLNSALFEWDGDRVRMVTTDGHRLSKMEVKVAGQQASATMLIPLKAIHELRALVRRSSRRQRLGARARKLELRDHAERPERVLPAARASSSA